MGGVSGLAARFVYEIYFNHTIYVLSTRRRFVRTTRNIMAIRYVHCVEKWSPELPFLAYNEFGFFRKIETEIGWAAFPFPTRGTESSESFCQQLIYRVTGRFSLLPAK